MSRTNYQEIQCSSALNPVQGMGFRWSLNPYRGCVHGCHYCFARRYHTLYDLSASEDFTDVIFVKTNIAAALRRELSRPSWRQETVALGTATDPYQPIEGKYRLTRRCLEALCTFFTPVGLVTKGTMVIRDVDVLADLARRTDSRVCFSITTLNADLWRRLEPGTPPPWQRLRAMEILVKNGVSAGVLLAPVVPGITDSMANLEAVVRGAAAHGAAFLGANVLYLKEGTKEHFMAFLESEYPHLLSTFRRLYPGAYAPRGVQDGLRARVDLLKETYGLHQSYRPAAGAPIRLGQLAMPV